jgi:crossover junction endodeoxyribonuclease RusA
MAGFIGQRITGENMKLILPWPPSNNHYWGSRDKYRYLTAKGKQYRVDTLLAVFASNRGAPKTMTGKLRVSITANPPDQRARDLDNLLKAPLDAMAKAGVYADDKQIDELTIKRGDVMKLGQLVVEIEVMSGDD